MEQVIFKAPEIWPLYAKKQQVLLCYVKTHGEDAGYKYDRRGSLNTLTALKQK
ncbi:MAG: hypothetical protein P1U40_09765 [Coxiellaceae bacterium]|nr:hypothetical protein [Coxiellaceae bacterium]